MSSDMHTAFEDAQRESGQQITSVTRNRNIRSRAGNGSQPSLDFDAERIATGLGWFSIGLGLLEVAAPGSLARMIGVPEDEENCRTLRLCGLRELASGIGILSQPQRPAGWVWSRVAGDAMDLTLLGRAYTSERTDKGRLLVATAAVIGVTALDVLCSEQLGESTAPPKRHTFTAWLERKLDRRIRTTRAVTVNRSPEELYDFWRDLENLPRFLPYLESVRALDERRSHWRAKAPLGLTVEWDSEITEDEPNRRIAWRSLPGASVTTSGEVSFEPTTGDRGTIVRVTLNYDPPGGMIGATFAKLFGKAPEQEIQQALRAFKQIMEVGEVVLSDASAKGWGAGQPPAEQPRVSARTSTPVTADH